MYQPEYISPGIRLITSLSSVSPRFAGARLFRRIKARAPVMRSKRESDRLTTRQPAPRALSRFD